MEATCSRRVVNPIPIVVVALIAIVLIALLVIAVVIIGVHGVGRKRAPELADVMTRTARQLNGDAAPPRGVRMIFDEMDRVSASDLSPRQLSGRIKSSIASARSAKSAQSPSAPPEVSDHSASLPSDPHAGAIEDPYGLVEGPFPIAEPAPVDEHDHSERIDDTVLQLDLPSAPSRR